MNEEKQLNIELAHFCPIYLYAKVDTTIKGEKRQRPGVSKIIIDIDNTGKSRKKRRASWLYRGKGRGQTIGIFRI